MWRWTIGAESATGRWVEPRKRGRPPKRDVSRPEPPLDLEYEEPEGSLLGADADAEDATDASVASIRDAVAALRGCAAKVRGMLKVQYNDRLASHLSWLTKNMVANLDALRKAEKEARNRAASLTRDEEVAIVKVWLEELDVRSRKEVAEYITELSRSESLLA